MFRSFWLCSYFSVILYLIFTVRAPLTGWLHKKVLLLLQKHPSPPATLSTAFGKVHKDLSYSFFAADKYCPLLIKEGGIPLLKDMIKMASARQETKEMAWQETNALSSNTQFQFPVPLHQGKLPKKGLCCVRGVKQTREKSRKRKIETEDQRCLYICNKH